MSTADLTVHGDEWREQRVLKEVSTADLTVSIHGDKRREQRGSRGRNHLVVQYAAHVTPHTAHKYICTTQQLKYLHICIVSPASLAHILSSVHREPSKSSTCSEVGGAEREHWALSN